MVENEITGEIIAAAIEVHKCLGGPGLLEDLYEEALACELILRGMDIQRQVSCPVHYKRRLLNKQLVIDLIVENKVIVECKATINHHEIFEAQLLTYLRLTNLKLGLVINFGQKQIKDGLKRFANGL